MKFLNQRGHLLVYKYTLPELLTVVVIVAILIGGIIAGGGAILNKAHENDTRGKLTMLKVAIEKYFDEYGEYPEPKDSECLYISEGGKLAKYVDYKALKRSNTLNKEDIAIDYWQQPVVYKVNNQNKNFDSNEATYSLYSIGADKKNGTDDDITIKE